jgi:hypothetical protein
MFFTYFYMKMFQEVRPGLLGGHVIDPLPAIQRLGNLAFRAGQTLQLKRKAVPSYRKTTAVPFSVLIFSIVGKLIIMTYHDKLFLQWRFLQKNKSPTTRPFRNPHHNFTFGM